jgi:hypothetical protein
LHDRNRHAAPPHKAPRQDRHEHDETEAVGAERHHHAVKDGDLPQRRHVGAPDKPDDQQKAAEEQQAQRPQAIDHRANQGRTRAGDELRYRIGNRGLGPAPGKSLDERDQKHRVGMHQPGADGERGKGAGQQQPRRARCRPCGGRRAGHRRRVAELRDAAQSVHK